MTKDQKCLSCGAPATQNKGTVPLCDSCAALAAGKDRGVEFGKKGSDAQLH